MANPIIQINESNLSLKKPQEFLSGLVAHNFGDLCLAVGSCLYLDVYSSRYGNRPLFFAFNDDYATCAAYCFC